jgi:hypothetical protein
MAAPRNTVTDCILDILTLRFELNSGVLIMIRFVA